MSKDLSSYILNEKQLKNGNQLILRKPMIEDAEKIIEYLNIVGGESDNLLFGKDEFHLTIEQEKEYIINLNNNPNVLMVLGIVEDNIVSIAQISSSNRKRIAHNSEIAISVRKDYWGNGIGSAMMQELIRFAKEYGTIRNISLGVRASNKNAIILYEKFGFQKIGLHKNYFNVNGSFDDEILMDLYI
ncbi:GNAT family N-acetyltransferase [Alkaliphilus sp. MSJ-5]|uniref:GNAT family N-acetyltransferase n=1 Tax=Alkaliphilus flagellatus TaxID=2841507 RepID=A0ABS6G1H2_9FIRM|nr:GNAT family N-acetyltransferase [Alkaliphilus flagellatus]MBU5676325.1 GNAT family N-acetyltransferase [Alkaliphilus flagellatus]